MAFLLNVAVSQRGYSFRLALPDLLRFGQLADFQIEMQAAPRTGDLRMRRNDLFYQGRPERGRPTIKTGTGMLMRNAL